jgi:prepilin-type N-terminal cleavage/methylation domain-containing protein
MYNAKERIGSSMRKGFTLVEMLIVIMTLPLVAMAADRLFRELVIDAPRSLDVVSQNDSVVRMLIRLQEDVGRATQVLPSYEGHVSNEQLLLLRIGDQVIGYKKNEDRIERHELSSPDEIDRIAYLCVAPQATIDWSLWPSEDSPSAVKVHTSIQHRRSLKQKLAGNYLFFVGAYFQGLSYENN